MDKKSTTGEKYWNNTDMGVSGKSKGTGTRDKKIGDGL